MIVNGKNLIGFHMQDSVPQWTESMTRSQNYTWHKFFHPEACAEAKTHNNNIYTIMRYVVNHQGELLDAVDHYEAARNFLSRFVDETFERHAWAIDAVEDLNEYVDNGKSGEEIEKLLSWQNALLSVWYNEYKTMPAYSHIDLIMVNAPIGNDIPLEMARLATQYGAYLGYHAYQPVRNGVIRSDDNLYYSGRWQVMDREYVANDLYVKWMFTEIGALGYEEYTNPDGSIGVSLKPHNGWRHDNVCNGNFEEYVSILEVWHYDTMEWNRTNGNRAFGGQVFTSTIASSGWDDFELNQPFMNRIADHFYFDDELTEEERLLQIVQETKTVDLSKLSIFDEASLYRKIQRDGFYCVGNEAVMNLFGSDSVVQGAQHPVTKELRGYFVTIGDWENVSFVSYG